MFDKIVDGFVKTFIVEDRYKMFLNGFWNTIRIAFVATLIGVAIGAIVAIIRVFHKQTGKLGILDKICEIYTTVIRGTPVVVQLLITYNIIFAWDSLRKTAEYNLETARKELIDRISVYKIFKDYEVIVVFDAYKVKGNRGEVLKEQGVTVVYTKESQTADAYIEKCAKELTKNYRVTVATSDGVEQMIIFGSGAFRLPARLLEEDVINVENNIKTMMESYHMETQNSDFFKIPAEKLEELKRSFENIYLG